MPRPQTGGVDICVTSSTASLVIVQNQAGRDEHDRTDREVLSGLVERVTFHNEDSGFASCGSEARGQRDLITVVSHAAPIGAGEFMRASTHGVQFRADFCAWHPPFCGTAKPHLRACRPHMRSTAIANLSTQVVPS